uniref:Uncharacterized protein n=1 Tax=Amphimedon queenslandica TaxID=400682 RepID=A0A1X7U5Y4_AMPQE
MTAFSLSVNLSFVPRVRFLASSLKFFSIAASTSLLADDIALSGTLKGPSGLGLEITTRLWLNYWNYSNNGSNNERTRRNDSRKKNGKRKKDEWKSSDKKWNAEKKIGENKKKIGEGIRKSYGKRKKIGDESEKRTAYVTRN